MNEQSCVPLAQWMLVCSNQVHITRTNTISMYPVSYVFQHKMYFTRCAPRDVARSDAHVARELKLTKECINFYREAHTCASKRRDNASESGMLMRMVCACDSRNYTR